MASVDAVKTECNVVEVSDVPSDAISRVQFCQSENRLIASSWDCTVRLYDSDDGKQISQVKAPAPVLDVAPLNVEDEGCRFVAGCLDNAVVLGDLQRPDAEISVLGHHSRPVRCVAVQDSTQAVFSGGWDGAVSMWDHRAGTKGSLAAQVAGKVFAMAVSDKASKMVVCDSTKTAYIFDTRKLGEPELTRDQVLKFQLRAAACFPDGTGYAVSSIEGRVAWEYFDPALGPGGARKNYAFKCHREKIEGSENVFSVNAIAFHPQYGSFATGGADGGVTIWDGLNRKRLWKLPQPFKQSVSSMSLTGSLTEPRLAVALSDLDATSTATPQLIIRTLKKEEVTK